MDKEIYDIIESQVRALCEKAEAKPWYMFQGEITGLWKWRQVSVFWHPERGWFESSVSYSKGWPHLHYAYGHTAESLIENISEIIK